MFSDGWIFWWGTAEKTWLPEKLNIKCICLQGCTTEQNPITDQTMRVPLSPPPPQHHLSRSAAVHYLCTGSDFVLHVL